MRLNHYFNPEEAEEQAKDNKLVALKYIGKGSRLTDRKGEGYFIANEGADGQWYFKPSGDDDFYRVKAENLDFEA